MASRWPLGFLCWHELGGPCTCIVVHPQAYAVAVCQAGLPGPSAHGVPLPTVDSPSVIVSSGRCNRARQPFAGGLKQQTLASASSGDCKAWIKVLADSAPDEGSLWKLQMADFSVCPHEASPQSRNRGRRESRGGEGGREALFYKKATYKSQ